MSKKEQAALLEKYKDYKFNFFKYEKEKVRSDVDLLTVDQIKWAKSHLEFCEDEGEIDTVIRLPDNSLSLICLIVPETNTKEYTKACDELTSLIEDLLGVYKLRKGDSKSKGGK